MRIPDPALIRTSWISIDRSEPVPKEGRGWNTRDRRIAAHHLRFQRAYTAPDGTDPAQFHAARLTTSDESAATVIRAYGFSAENTSFMETALKVRDPVEIDIRYDEGNRIFREWESCSPRLVVNI